MLDAIRHGLGNLLNAQGRDGRQAFWFYILFLVLLNVAAAMLMMVPMVLAVFQSAFDAAQSGVSEEVAAARMASGMAGWAETMVWVSSVATLATTALATAAFIRRLHDAGRSGLWVLLPIAAQIATVVVGIVMLEEMRAIFEMSMALDQTPAMLEQEGRLTLYSLVGWVAPIIVVIFGVMKSTGPNRFGDTTFNV